MIDPASRQTVVDDEHLRLLSMGYLLSGVMTALFSLIGLAYAGLGLMVGTLARSAAKTAGARSADAPPEVVGLVFATFGGLMFLILIGFAVAKFVAASRIRTCRSRTFCLVIAGIACLGIPYGTCLGVCTFLVLGRPSVADRFAGGGERVKSH